MGILSRHPDHEEEEEYDDALFYEDIQAPKFVDFTAPDAGRPDDDPAWFCLRVGHGGEKPQRAATEGYQQEEPELDAEMPALCAAEASEGSVREAECGDGGRGEGTGEAQAKGPADLRPASIPNPYQGCEGGMSQREEEGTDNAAEQVRPAEAGAVPQREAPEGAVRRCGQEGDGRQGSVHEHAKEGAGPDAGGRQGQGDCVRGLFQAEEAELGVPGGAEQVHESEEESEGCQEGRGDDGGQERETGQESKMNAKKKILVRSVKCANAESDRKNRNGCSSTVADENSLAETASSDQERKVVLQELRIEVDTSRSDNSDDNKENLSSAPTEEALDSSHSEIENRQLENNENVPLMENVALKVAKLQSKVHQEQAGKLKKTTNPRPFRLRTDERGVLKEAKPGKRQPFAENNSMAVLKDSNRGVTQMDKHTHGKGRDKPTCGKKQKKQSTQIVTGQQQLGESRPAFNSIQCKTVKPQTVSRVAASSSTRTTKTASGLMAPSRVGKERKATVKLSRFQTTVA
ncbi:unnamed protein product [Miscanthus lutarioriparius]|uniref:Uncharacterized protein n=1 Tax=Miscanthus lutarioriparius TaxID=422564 RepID=A0A811MTF1_9POAL|nr:unnamed protein product [Miscanthus lutarioriparius]